MTDSPKKTYVATSIKGGKPKISCYAEPAECATRSERMYRCSCGSDHKISFVSYPDEEEVYVEVMYHNHSFWRRLKNAFTYLFTGDYILVDEVILDSEDVDDLQKFLDFSA